MKVWVKRAQKPIEKRRGPRDMEMWASETDKKGKAQPRRSETPAPVRTKMVQPKATKSGRTQRDVVTDYNAMKDKKKVKKK